MINLTVFPSPRLSHFIVDLTYPPHYLIGSLQFVQKQRPTCPAGTPVLVLFRCRPGLELVMLAAYVPAQGAISYPSSLASGQHTL